MVKGFPVPHPASVLASLLMLHARVCLPMVIGCGAVVADGIAGRWRARSGRASCIGLGWCSRPPAKWPKTS